MYKYFISLVDVCGSNDKQIYKHSDTYLSTYILAEMKILAQMPTRLLSSEIQKQIEEESVL